MCQDMPRSLISAGCVTALLALFGGASCNLPPPVEQEPDAGWSPDAPDSDPLPPDDGSATDQDLGVGDGTDVVTLGDSYMRLPNALQQPGSEGVELSLEKAGNRTYRKYGYTGGRLLPPRPVAILNDVIPNQFTRAVQQNPNIMTVVIAGGGNDLTDACNGPTTEADLSDRCKTLLDQIDAASDTLIAKMAQAGVRDVVWVGYGDTTTTGQRVFRGALDYLRTKRIAKCVANDPSLGLRCHYVDNKGRPGLDTRDGFHPDAAGYDLIGKAVWDRMVAEGVRR